MFVGEPTIDVIEESESGRACIDGFSVAHSAFRLGITTLCIRFIEHIAHFIISVGHDPGISV